MYEVEIKTVDNTGDYVKTLDLNDTSAFTNLHICDSFCSHAYNYYSTTWYPTTKYLYQIFCPKPRCKKANWLELDQMKECTKCGSLLKAVSKKAEFEIEVDA